MGVAKTQSVRRNRIRDENKNKIKINMAAYWMNLRAFKFIFGYRLFFVILIFMLKCRATRLEGLGALNDEETHTNIECPVSSENSACPCYKFEDGK